MKKATDRRKVLAVLAGGVVLGVGAAVTLAAWNDSEFATGTFTAGQFNLEGSIDNGEDYEFEDHASVAGAAALSFTAPFDNLAPTDTVYAPFWVRLDDTTTTDATLVASTVTANTPADDNNDANLSYTVYAIDAAAVCGAAGVTGAPVVASGTTLTALTVGVTLDLEAGADDDAGVPVQLCFVVTAGANLVQGKSSTATWEFVATSTS